MIHGDKNYFAVVEETALAQLRNDRALRRPLGRRLSTKDQRHTHDFRCRVSTPRRPGQGGRSRAKTPSPNKWLADRQQDMFVEINPADAAARGVSEGGRMWVDGSENNARIRVRQWPPSASARASPVCRSIGTRARVGAPGKTLDSDNVFALRTKGGGLRFGLSHTPPYFSARLARSWTPEPPPRDCAR